MDSVGFVCQTVANKRNIAPIRGFCQFEILLFCSTKKTLNNSIKTYSIFKDLCHENLLKCVLKCQSKMLIKGILKWHHIISII